MNLDLNSDLMLDFHVDLSNNLFFIGNNTDDLPDEENFHKKTESNEYKEKMLSKNNENY